MEYPKFGEIIAFKKVLSKIPPTAVDEEEIVGIIKSKGYEGVYVPEALINNYGPRRIKDIIIQRRRIYAGHLALEKQTGYKVPTINNVIIMKKLIKIPHSKIIWTLGAIIIESYARLLGTVDYYILKKKHVIWNIAKSSKKVFN